VTYRHAAFQLTGFDCQPRFSLTAALGLVFVRFVPSLRLFNQGA